MSGSEAEDMEKKVRRRKKERRGKGDDKVEDKDSDEDSKRKARRERRRRRKEEDGDMEEGGGNLPKDDEVESDSRKKRRERRKKKQAEEEGEKEERVDEEGKDDDGEDDTFDVERKKKKKKGREKKPPEEDDERTNMKQRKKAKHIEIERREFDPTQYDFEIDPEDFMESTSILPVDQKSHFLRLNVPPPIVTITGTEDYALTREEEYDNQSSRMDAKPHGYVYVESATTGRFKRMKTTRLGYRQLSAGDEGDDGSMVNGPEVMTHFTDSVNAVTAAFYQFAQGLLAGLALLHVYVTQMFSDNGEFISVYWPFAGETRRLFFALTTVAFAAAYDLYLRESSRSDLWQVQPVTQRVRVYVILFLYFVALLCSLLVMPIDNALNTLGSKGQDAAGDLLSDSKIYEWNVYEIIRAVSCICAWILVCTGIHEENQNGRRFMAHCKYLKGQITQQKLRLDKVSGKQLQYATQNELDELLAIQKSAQEATERAISYYRSRDRS